MIFNRKSSGLEYVSEDTLNIIKDIKGGLEIASYYTVSGASEGHKGFTLHEIQTPDDTIYVTGYKRYQTLPASTFRPLAVHSSRTKTTYLYLYVPNVIATYRDGKYTGEFTPKRPILSVKDLKKYIWENL